ncbi:hypothetical protein PBI_NEBKISS_136 [Mycobacterium phage Nebkiss]|nr:hypothetical protein PBI_NEBKISS_136 [Mycobacterium phage Nebkiss]
MIDTVRHRGTPSEPWAKPGEYGVITRTDTDRLRITPGYHGSPSLAHVSWADGTYHTWERLCDLQPAGKKRGQ